MITKKKVLISLFIIVFLNLQSFAGFNTVFSSIYPVTAPITPPTTSTPSPTPGTVVTPPYVSPSPTSTPVTPPFVSPTPTHKAHPSHPAKPSHKPSPTPNLISLA